MHENRAGMKPDPNFQRMLDRLLISAHVFLPVQTSFQPVFLAFLDHLGQLQSEEAGVIREIEDRIHSVSPRVYIPRRMLAGGHQL